MTAPLTLRFVTSAPDVASLPPTSAEVCVAGRSNVGKSSLLNALAGSERVAKVSSTPGRTRLLNCFEVEGGGTVVDLPGYGYAAASKQERAAWRRRLEQYLTDRAGLRGALLLIDGEIGPTRLDVEMLAWLRGAGVPFDLVATKHDKVKPSKRERRKQDLAAACDVAPSDVYWVSAEKGTGLDRLRGRVLGLLT